MTCCLSIQFHHLSLIFALQSTVFELIGNKVPLEQGCQTHFMFGPKTAHLDLNWARPLKS